MQPGGKVLCMPPGRARGLYLTKKRSDGVSPNFDKLGLSYVEMDAVLTLILTHVEGACRAQVTRDRTQQETEMTDEEWWVARAPLLDKLIDPARFPVATRVGTSAGQEYQSASSPEFAFTFGLERILAGIAELIAAKNSEENTNH